MSPLNTLCTIAILHDLVYSIIHVCVVYDTMDPHEIISLSSFVDKCYPQTCINLIDIPVDYNGKDISC